MLNSSSPTPKDRRKLIRKSETQFKRSDESAYSIVPSRMSSRFSLSTCQTGARESVKSEEDILYRRLSFEDDLFTAKVYKRNYRSATLLRPWTNKHHRVSGTKFQSNAARKANTDTLGDGRTDLSIGQNLLIGQSPEDFSAGSIGNTKIPSIPVNRHIHPTYAVCHRDFVLACEQDNYPTIEKHL